MRSCVDLGNANEEMGLTSSKKLTSIRLMDNVSGLANEARA